jgi:hypothetical protein
MFIRFQSSKRKIGENNFVVYFSDICLYFSSGRAGDTGLYADKMSAHVPNPRPSRSSGRCVRVSKKHSPCWVLDFPKRVVNLVYNISVPFMLFYRSNITLVYNTLVQQIYMLWKILLVYTLQSTVLCVRVKCKS